MMFEATAEPKRSTSLESRVCQFCKVWGASEARTTPLPRYDYVLLLHA